MDPLQIAVERGVITAQKSAEITAAGSTTQAQIETALLDAGVEPAVVGDIFSTYYEVPFFTLPDTFIVGQDILNLVPEDSAIHYKMMPLRIEDGVLLVGVNDPDNLQMREALNFISTKHNTPYKLLYMLQVDITKVHESYQNLEGDVGDALETLEGELDAEIAASLEESGETTQKETTEHIEEDAPVTKIVATILRYAVDGKASDIHIEPTRQKVEVRFRVDGALAKSLELPKNVHMAVVARVKILSSMRLDERRKPQDGRFSATFDGRRIDFRVSVLPTNHGEKVVMRILDTSQGVLTLENLGISTHNLNLLKKIANVPYGIVLISGPTGSGKSTTLRGMIQEVDTLAKNVMSLEDPVEYNMTGVSQSQVRPEIGYTFAHGLRAALRQDPDIIMVGEIRDKETAQLAIQAALTGHLVLSTIHTNNAIGVIPRLIDMGIDPYLIAPTLKLAIAQRLARTLCPGTGVEEDLSPSVQKQITETFSSLPEQYRGVLPQSTTIRRPEPTPQCATGMRGRTAVTEVLEVNESIQELILKNAPEEEFFQAAREQGFVTLQEDSMIKCLQHQIPLEEMNAFSTKLAAEEEAVSVQADVDNQAQEAAQDDIMTDDEGSAAGS